MYTCHGDADHTAFDQLHILQKLTFAQSVVKSMGAF